MRVDICKILDKCNIEEISKYLIKKGKKRKFSRYNFKRVRMKKLNIAIIGLGNIGSYLYKYLKKTKKYYQKKIIVYQIFLCIS